MAKPKRTKSAAPAKKSEPEETPEPEEEAAQAVGRVDGGWVVKTPHGNQDTLLGGTLDGYSPGVS